MDIDLEEMKMEYVDCELTDYLEESIKDSYPNSKIVFIEEGSNLTSPKDINRYVIFYDDTHFITHIHHG